MRLSILLVCFATVVLASASLAVSLDHPPAATGDGDGGGVQSDSKMPFVATEEWQDIGEDTPIPAGLHVSIDLATGVKRAKLLPEEERNSKASSGGLTTTVAASERTTVDEWDNTTPGAHHGEKKMPKVTVLTKEELRERLVTVGSDDHLPENLRSEMDTTTTMGHQFNLSEHRTAEELRQIMREMEESKTLVQDDVTLMKELVGQISAYKSAPVVVVEAALLSLEELVHQVDNGRDLDTIGGLTILISMLKDPREKVAVNAALVVGSALQSNGYLQTKAFGYGLLADLLNLMRSNSLSPLLQKRLLYCLSALLRRYPEAQAQFVAMNGMVIITRMLEQTEKLPQLQSRLLTFVADLIVEQNDTPAAPVNIFEHVYNAGWCLRVPALLNHAADDTLPASLQEKALELLDVMLTRCCRGNWRTESRLEQYLERLSRHAKTLEDQDSHEAALGDLAGPLLLRLRSTC